MTKYDVFRRRLAPIAFGLAIAFMAYRTCDQQERTTATFIIEYGAAEPDVRSIEAQVWMNGEQVTELRRQAIDDMFIGKTQFKASLPDTDGELRMDVELRSGEHRNVTRAIHITQGGTVTVQLERDLR